MFKADLTRTKNTANIMRKNMMTFCSGAFGYRVTNSVLMMRTTSMIIERRSWNVESI
ncbi:MAG: hypothetical protein ABFC71_03525 [Methanoregula sp.]